VRSLHGGGGATDEDASDDAVSVDVVATVVVSVPSLVAELDPSDDASDDGLPALDAVGSAAEAVVDAGSLDPVASVDGVVDSLELDGGSATEDDDSDGSEIPFELDELDAAEVDVDVTCEVEVELDRADDAVLEVVRVDEAVLELEGAKEVGADAEVDDVVADEDEERADDEAGDDDALDEVGVEVLPGELASEGEVSRSVEVGDADTWDVEGPGVEFAEGASTPASDSAPPVELQPSISRTEVARNLRVMGPPGAPPAWPRGA